MVAASSKVTPCLRRFVAAFVRLQTKMRPSTSSVSSFRPTRGTLPVAALTATVRKGANVQAPRRRRPARPVRALVLNIDASAVELPLTHAGCCAGSAPPCSNTPGRMSDGRAR